MLKSLIITLLLKLVSSSPINKPPPFMEKWITFENNPTWLSEGDIAKLFSRKVSPSTKLWTNANVDYVLDSTLSPDHIKAIISSIDEWEKKTCIKLTDQTSNANFDINQHHVRFTDDDKGCYSYIGAVDKKPQPINIGPNCEYPFIVIHEIGHAIGFQHEQARSDRNNFIKILRSNINPKFMYNFNKTFTKNDVKYDFFSIMHYQPELFSRKIYEKNTMHSMDPRYQYIMGRAEKLSFNDEKTANELYCTAGYASACGLSTKDVCNSGYLQKDCSCKCHYGTSGKNCQYGKPIERGLPCGKTITNNGTYTTPNYPRRANTWEKRSCVWIIKAPTNKKAKVFFDHFSFYKRYDYNGNMICYDDLVEVRTGGRDKEAEFKCDTELDKKTVQSEGEEMVILINSRFTEDKGNGMKFTVNFV